MTLSDKLPNGRPAQPAPALAKLLSDSALSRAALAVCGFPVALADASAKGRPITYVNSAFEKSPMSTTSNAPSSGDASGATHIPPAV